MAGADYGMQIYKNGVLQPEDCYECGSDDVKLIPAKTFIELIVGKEIIDLEAFVLDTWQEEFMTKGAGVFNGHTFTWRESKIGGHFVCDFYLREPNGDVWHGRTGYMQHDESKYETEIL